MGSGAAVSGERRIRKNRMPTDIKVTRVKQSGPQVKLSLKFQFDGDDPKASKIYSGIGLMLSEILSPDEAREFLTKLNAARRNPKGGEISGRVK
jgi:hypothetical protein